MRSFGVTLPSLHTRTGPDGFTYSGPGQDQQQSSPELQSEDQMEGAKVSTVSADGPEQCHGY